MEVKTDSKTLRLVFDLVSYPHDTSRLKTVLANDLDGLSFQSSFLFKYEHVEAYPLDLLSCLVVIDIEVDLLKIFLNKVKDKFGYDRLKSEIFRNRYFIFGCLSLNTNLLGYAWIKGKWAAIRCFVDMYNCEDIIPETCEQMVNSGLSNQLNYPLFMYLLAPYLSLNGQKRLCQISPFFGKKDQDSAERARVCGFYSAAETRVSYQESDPIHLVNTLQLDNFYVFSDYDLFYNHIRLLLILKPHGVIQLCRELSCLISSWLMRDRMHHLTLLSFINSLLTKKITPPALVIEPRTPSISSATLKRADDLFWRSDRIFTASPIHTFTTYDSYRKNPEEWRRLQIKAHPTLTPMVVTIAPDIIAVIRLLEASFLSLIPSDKSPWTQYLIFLSKLPPELQIYTALITTGRQFRFFTKQQYKELTDLVIKRTQMYLLIKCRF